MNCTTMACFVMISAMFDVFLDILAFLVVIWAIFGFCMFFNYLYRYSSLFGRSWAKFDRKRQKQGQTRQIGEYQHVDYHVAKDRDQNGKVHVYSHKEPE